MKVFLPSKLLQTSRHRLLIPLVMLFPAFKKSERERVVIFTLFQFIIFFLILSRKSSMLFHIDDAKP